MKWADFDIVTTQLIRNFDWAIADPMRGIDSYAHQVHIQSKMNLVAWPRR